ncbi:MAG: tetratricopeptide repeat protein [Blastocatellia bacterium]|nr:tetratricopeptide repeat protein [Blastocatellia bacterium]
MSRNIKASTLGHIYRLLLLVSFTALISVLVSQDYIFLIFGATLFLLLLVASRFEKITFNGQVLKRSGLFAFCESLLTRQKQALQIEQIEMVTTEAIRSRLGRKKFKYVYKVTATGEGTHIPIMVSSGKPSTSSELVKNLFSLLDENKLDPRSGELRDYLHQLDQKERQDEVIEFVINTELNESSAEIYKKLPSKLLREIANRLKLEGFMHQAFHCFSFAYKREPGNAQLLYEMARFFRSLGSISHPRLLSRSGACLRLAAFLAKDEPRLLERIGETHFEQFEYKKAANCFSKALSIDPTLYRANIGLAEIALRDGKLAHVAHFYQAAATVSSDKAQKNLALREADYYNRLCSDEDYFEAEISRITKLQNFQWVKNSSSLLLVVFWLLATLSGWFSQELKSLAWSAVLSTSVVWIGSIFLSSRYSHRNS